MIIGDILKDLMRKDGITQSQLAKALGISRQSVSQMLKQDDMKLSTVVMILSVLGYAFKIVRAGDE